MSINCFRWVRLGLSFQISSRHQKAWKSGKMGGEEWGGGRRGSEIRREIVGDGGRGDGGVG